MGSLAVAAIDMTTDPDAIDEITAPGAIPSPVRGSFTVRPRPVVVAGDTKGSVVLPLEGAAVNEVAPRDTTVAFAGIPGPETG